MKNVRNLTEQNKKALLELPVGFPVQLRNVTPGDEGDWEDAYVVSVDAEGGYYGEFQVVLSYWNNWESEWCLWPLSERYSRGYRYGSNLAYGSGSTPVSVRWSSENLRAFRALSDDLVLAQTVASLLVSR